MVWVRCTANRSNPPVGVGTRNVCPVPDRPATGALRSVAATPATSTSTAEYLLGVTRTFGSLASKPPPGR